MPQGYVYILGSTTGTLYTGITSDLNKLLLEHKSGIRSDFATKYGCHRLLHHEIYDDIRQAISREKQIKGWTRAKKIALITQHNPTFRDLAAQLGWQILSAQEKIRDQQ